MPLDNPIGSYLDMAQMRNQNKRNMYGDMAGVGYGLGQGLASIGDMIGEQKKKALIMQIMQQMKNQQTPVQGPQGYAPPNQGPNSTAVPAGQTPPPDPQKMQGLLMQADPQGMIKSMIPPDQLQQSEIAKNMAMAQRYGGAGAAAKPVGTIYRHSGTGEMTDDPSKATGPEWKAYKTSQGDMLNKLAGQTASQGRNEAMKGRNEVWNRSIDTKQIDSVVSRTGLTPKMQGQLQQNTMRALRAYIPILSRPKITYQELALGEIDLAGIMQGGVPMADEVHNTHFPGWQEKWGQLKTYATGHPQEVVPDEVRLKVRQMVGDVVKIDNTFIHANQKFTKSMLGPTIRGGITPGQNKAMDEMTGTLTPQLGESTGTSSGWSYVGPAK